MHLATITGSKFLAEQSVECIALALKIDLLSDIKLSIEPLSSYCERNLDLSLLRLVELYPVCWL